MIVDVPEEPEPQPKPDSRKQPNHTGYPPTGQATYPGLALVASTSRLVAR